MFKGFNITVPESHFDNWQRRGNLIHQANKIKVQSSLDSFFDTDGILSAAKISNNWFPGVQADVFISHSHKDSKAAIGLAGWLEDEFGLKSFIDSTVWGYSEDLLRQFDNEFCFNSEKKTYNYYRRNKTTNHVNIMLASALNNMIDGSEVVFFLNTPNSISCEGYVTESATDSPWIFSEIAMTRLIERKNSRNTAYIRKVKASFESISEDAKIKYDLPLDHLISIDAIILTKWKNSVHAQGADSLDSLYQITS